MKKLLTVFIVILVSGSVLAETNNTSKENSDAIARKQLKMQMKNYKFMHFSRKSMNKLLGNKENFTNVRAFVVSSFHKQSTGWFSDNGKSINVTNSDDVCRILKYDHAIGFELARSTWGRVAMASQRTYQIDTDSKVKKFKRNDSEKSDDFSFFTDLYCVKKLSTPKRRLPSSTMRDIFERFTINENKPINLNSKDGRKVKESSWFSSNKSNNSKSRKSISDHRINAFANQI